MIKDRLQELRARQPGGFAPVDQVAVLISGSNNKNKDQWVQISTYLAEVEDVRALIESIVLNTEELRRLHGIIESLPMAQDKSSSQVDSRCSSMQRAIAQVRAKLLEMERQSEGRDVDCPLERIRSIQYASLSRLFMDAVGKYNCALVRHREKCAQLVREQLHITERRLPDDELEDLLDRGESAVFVDNIISDSLNAKLTLDAVLRRQEELAKVERSIEQVRDSFVQIALLVESQGDTMDRIEHYVDSATAFSERTKRKIEKNERKKNRRRKRKYKCIFFTTVVILLVVVILIYLG